MTIEQYFKSEQPISDKTIKDTCLYKDVKTIEFRVRDFQYAAIKIARIENDIWALGYEIQPCESMSIICKDCTTHALTKGHINSLIYGMTKVLLLHLPKTHCTKPLEEAINEGIKEAEKYYIKPSCPIGKITI